MKESLEPKKLALLRILQILEQYTCPDHPLTQDDIAARLAGDYGIELERKAIGRNLSLLKEAGYDIESDRRGSYLASREFDDSELRMLIDGVLASKYITARHSKELIEKLCALSDRHFRAHVKNIWSVNEWSKTDNCAVFYNIEVADAAIERGRQIEFVYNKYGADKKLHRTAKHLVSPYQFILHNQRYYLVACNEKWKNIGHYRLDRITDIRMTDEPATPLRSLPGYEKGIDYKQYATSLPYMFTDMPETVEFVADPGIVDQIVDWFGDNAHIAKVGDRLKVTVKVSPYAMKYWAMQYLNHVEVLSPASLRREIADDLARAADRYSGGGSQGVRKGKI